jgi:hypothetical protein
MLRHATRLAVAVLAAGCSGMAPPGPAPAHDWRSSIGLCGAGLDSSTRAYAEAVVLRGGGRLGAGLQSELRAAFVNAMAGRNASAAEINTAYAGYLGCVQAAIERDHRRVERYEAAACRRACCTQHDCDSGCAMTTVEGLTIPANDGDTSSCPSAYETQFGCRPTPYGGQWCGPMQVRISFTKLRSCIRNCKSLD